MGWPAIQGYENKEAVEADVLNRPLRQLAERTEYLYNMLSEKDNTKVAITDAVISDPTLSGKYPTVGQPVYRYSDGTYAVATGLSKDNAWFYADPQAMAVGVVSSISGTKATVVLYGRIQFGEKAVKAKDVISDTITSNGLKSGRYYLSTSTGKLTRHPNGPVIYVCDCHFTSYAGDNNLYVDSMLVSPQYRDTGESHIHRSFVISSSPMGGYAVRYDERYHAPGIVDTEYTRNAEAMPTGLCIEPCGTWTYPKTDAVTYDLELTSTYSAPDTWDKCKLKWSSVSDGSGEIVASVTAPLTVGTHGLKVWLRPPSTYSVKDFKEKKWKLVMPDAARAWVDYEHTFVEGDSTKKRKGFRLNLGMYHAMGRFVPPVPENSAALTVAGTEKAGIIFGNSKCEWLITPEDETGGPWLVWLGGEVSGETRTAPFVWNTGTASKTLANAGERNIVLSVNRMRVGPSGFVTSLQPAPGSPLRVTSAQTGEDAAQGALQLSLDVDFKTSDGNAVGNQVVKKIVGSTFITGPVVEKIVAGPGISAIPEDGQGTVTISVSNAVYSGDFETIALKNAKQSLAGGIFPYTKLLGWTNGSASNIATGFTAKFRVPDNIPYRKDKGGYHVIVSASVFGENGVAASNTQAAAFNLTNYVLPDYACSKDVAAVSLSGSIANPANMVGRSSAINVAFKGAYTAFDPVLIHGFSNTELPDVEPQRKQYSDLLLKQKDSDAPIVVYPGYFVGLEITRCDMTGAATQYTGPIGFLSLRWNLVEA